MPTTPTSAPAPATAHAAALSPHNPTPHSAGNPVSTAAAPAPRLPVLHVTIPGEPVAQGRPIAGRWAAKDGRSGISLRDPGKSRWWKAEAAALIRREVVRFAAEHGPGYCVAFAEPAPVAVYIEAVFPCPASAHRKREPAPRAWAVAKRNDADNVAKACLDACTRAGVWDDDGQVVALNVTKIRAAQGESPRVSILIMRQEATP